MSINKKISIVAIIFIAYCAVILLSNIIMEEAIIEKNETLEAVSGMLFGFLAIPVLSIILPLMLANKWKIPYSIWPKTKNVWLVIFILLSFFC